MIIDFHTHAFPEKVAEKALPRLAHTAGGVSPCHDGTAEALLAYVKKSGADKAVFLSIATNPKQQRNVNDFAIEKNGGGLLAFGSVHPDSPEAFEELERIRGAGLRGVKLHPDYQGFFVDEERLFPLYEKIASLGLITVFHAGVDIGYPDPVHCTPQRLLNILPVFGGAPVVAAHMGGYLLWQEVERLLTGTSIYLDTAFSAGRMPPEYARRIIRRHGADKILFGSDMPWSGTDAELRFVRSLGLEQEEENLILGENAAKLLTL